MRIFGVIYIALFLASCSEEKEEKVVVYPFDVPAQLGTMPSFEDNRITKEGIELGRRLFYDERLSANNQVSCASCHRQKRAFADDVALSDIGHSGKPLMRNSPALFNLSWYDGFFWDGGNTSLEVQVLGPLTHNDEMSKDPRVLIKALERDALYPQLFEKAFGEKGITLRKLAYAIAQFERSLISANSKYDHIGDEGVELTEIEKKGEALYQNNCASCHSGYLFTDVKYHNNGLDDSWYYDSNEDPRYGRFRITLDSADMGKYRTPSLRNLVFTAPYMHDGRFGSIEEVVNFYSEKVKASETLDSLLQPVGDKGFRFRHDEKMALVAFLKTLTDSSFVTDTSYSSPFE